MVLLHTVAQIHPYWMIIALITHYHLLIAKHPSLALHFQHSTAAGRVRLALIQYLMLHLLPEVSVNQLAHHSVQFPVD